jgi:hypothetical protein
MIFSTELITHLIDYIENTSGTVEFACNYSEEDIKSWYMRIRVADNRRFSHIDISLDYDVNGKITLINKVKVPIDLTLLEEAINMNIQRAYKFKRKEKKLTGD